ncbi:M20/M25/M40 family metallo-hydrolase [Ensifer sp. 2YAB10]|uniref:M20/M25/M40 family metallo-hydrolase n=1 Tax=unclassified Ensifer TaxID=2633371 RepID=UPI003F9228E6
MPAETGSDRIWLRFAERSNDRFCSLPSEDGIVPTFAVASLLTGLTAIYEGREPGRTLMVRAELDGLPIEEISEISHRSEIQGKGHLCGHDGHMTILMALAKGLGQMRPAKGRAILMFQPAEENGAGAAEVLSDPQFTEIKPDLVFSLRNFPD